MKNIKRTLSALTIALLALCSLTVGYASNPKSDGDTLTVKLQVRFLKNFTHIEKNDCGLSIAADLPVNGPKKLVDSITVFLNEQLYEYFDYSTDGNHLLPYEKVFSTNIPNLLKHYQKAYRPFYDVKDPDVCEFATNCLQLNMVAQTPTYVTYEVVDQYFGEGLEEARTWVTFDKSDGHRLKEVITTDNLLRLFQEQPDQRDDGIWNDIIYTLNEYGHINAYRIGLLNDSVAFQYVWAPGIYEDFKYSMEPWKPYLTPEAQKLVNGR